MDGQRGDLRLYDVGLDWLQWLLLGHGTVTQALWGRLGLYCWPAIILMISASRKTIHQVTNVL